MVNIFGNSDGDGISRPRLSFANFGSNIFLLAFIGFVIIGLVLLSYGIGIYTNFLWFGHSHVHMLWTWVIPILKV